MESSDVTRILHTEVCDMFGIKYPIFLAGMGAGVSGPTLTAAVSNAGGLGILGGTGLYPEDLRTWIRKTKSLTDRPFGVDLLIPTALPGSGSSAELRAMVPAEKKTYVKRMMQELGLPDTEPGQKRPLTAEIVRKQAEVIMEEGVAVFASGLGSPDWIVREAHSIGMKVIALVGNVRNARSVAEAGVDIIVAQGHEAGGHTGRIGTMALVPQVVDAVKPIPVLAAGGIADGRGFMASLSLGAKGIWCGTVFVATKEALIDAVHPDIDYIEKEEWFVNHWKKKLIESTEADTCVTRVYTGKTLRTIKNEFTERWEKDGETTLPMPLQSYLVEELVEAASQARMEGYLMTIAGQITGMIKEVKSAGEVVENIVNGAAEKFRDLGDAGRN